MTYKPGDIANGHVLTEQMQWVPLAPPPPVNHGPLTSRNMTVKPEVSYVRVQKGHSLTLHLLFGWIALYIPTVYYAVSPNHFWTL